MKIATPIATPIATVALTLIGLTTSVQAQFQTPSGLLLGVYAQAVNRGMYVTSTIPGYSAVGRLERGDILTQATAEGLPIYALRSMRELEFAKSAIGPNREAAIEFYRPGVGYMYAWVEFTPLMGPAAAATVNSTRSQVKQYGAKFRLESEKPGARRLFNKQGSHQNSRVVPEQTQPRKPIFSPSKPAPGSSKGPASLFQSR